ncbi:Nudix hydrolase domain-containing protein [Balamuthia mandrillaris]
MSEKESVTCAPPGCLPVGCFAVVVVRNDAGQFLVVQETRKNKCLWYLPAGRVEFKESFEEAALRETKEEAGIDITLDGILRVEFSPAKFNGKGVFCTKLRVLFLAHHHAPAQPLKTEPDEHSMQARWVSLEEAQKLPLRSNEVVQLFQWVHEQAAREALAVHPLSLLAPEGTPFSSLPSSTSSSSSSSSSWQK